MGIFKRINEWKTSGDLNSKPPKPPALERLEPRILLSGDGLLYSAASDPYINGTQPVVHYAKFLETNGQVEQQPPTDEQELCRELSTSDTLESDLSQPLFSLHVNGAEPMDTDAKLGEDSRVDDSVGLVQNDAEPALLSNDSEEIVDGKTTLIEIVDAEEPIKNSPVVPIEGGNMPIYNTDADLSIEYATSIEIRGPPAGEAVNSEHMSSWQMDGDTLVFKSSSEQNDLTLRLSVDDVSILELVDNSLSVVLASHYLEGISYVLIEGSDDIDDTLTLDFSTGLPFNLDIEFNGGQGGFDSLVLNGNSTLEVDYTAVGLDSGRITLSDGATTITVSFTGLEPVTVSGVTDYTFTTSGGSDMITIDSPAVGQNRISGTNRSISFESVTFFNVA